MVIVPFKIVMLTYGHPCSTIHKITEVLRVLIPRQRVRSKTANTFLDVK